MGTKDIIFWLCTALAALSFVAVLAAEVAARQTLYVLLTVMAGSLVAFVVSVLAKVPIFDKNAWKDERLVRFSANSVRVSMLFVLILIVVLAEYETLTENTVKMSDVLWAVVGIAFAVNHFIYSVQNHLG
ncbi:MAG: hypothetical protein AB1324_05035 [Candidatus Micrarchaeota archaeon]